MNLLPDRIRVSFDQNLAVRDDGLRLKARGDGPYRWLECHKCEAFNSATGHSCWIPETPHRHCAAENRKDGRNIHWVREDATP